LLTSQAEAFYLGPASTVNTSPVNSQRGRLLQRSNALQRLTQSCSPTRLERTFSTSPTAEFPYKRHENNDFHFKNLHRYAALVPVNKNNMILRTLFHRLSA
jgi:hypothetical protein